MIAAAMLTGAPAALVLLVPAVVILLAITLGRDLWWRRRA